MDDIRSKIAQYIVGEIKLNELMSSHRFSLPLQKRYKFDGTWITMNRKIGEAIVDRLTTPQPRAARKKSYKPTSVQKRRRNAVTVIDLEKRLMSNGLTWPIIDDWMVSSDKRIRYVPLLEPLRKINEDEWTLAKVSADDTPQSSSSIPIVRTCIYDEQNTTKLAANDVKEAKTRCEKASCSLHSSSPIAYSSCDNAST